MINTWLRLVAVVCWMFLIDEQRSKLDVYLEKRKFIARYKKICNSLEFVFLKIGFEQEECFPYKISLYHALLPSRSGNIWSVLVLNLAFFPFCLVYPIYCHVANVFLCKKIQYESILVRFAASITWPTFGVAVWMKVFKLRYKMT